MDTPEEHYARILRINVPLRKLFESKPDNEYFQRLIDFNMGSYQWPQRFKSAIESNWLLTEKEISKARQFFIDSAKQLEIVARALVERNIRIKVSFIVLMHKEKSRLSPPDEENPLAEDSVRKKISQLEELFGGTNIDWELVFVSHVRIIAAR
jgi:hypothetical protein